MSIKRGRSLTALVVVIAGALSVAGCSADGGAGGSDGNTETVKIGFIGPLSGPSSTTGADQRDGTKLAIDEANEAGTIPGVTFELLEEDDKSTPQDGVVALQKFTSQGVQIVTGTVNSSVAIAMATAIESMDDVLYVITGAQSQVPLDEQPANRVVGLMHDNAMFAAATHPWIAENAKPKKVAFVGENSDFGVAELNQLTESWSEPGSPKIVTKETFERDQTDFSSIVAQIRESGADAVYVAAGSPTISAGIFRQVDQAGLKVQKYMNSGLMGQPLIDEGGDAVEGLTAGDVYNANLDNDVNREFVAAFEKKFGKKPSPVNELGYESAWMVIQAMKETGTTTDMDKIATAMRDASYDTPRGTVTFDDSGRAQSDTVILTVKDGDFAIVDTVSAG